MLNKLSIKWKMTIFSAVLIFIIFIICNLIQLILIHTFTAKQEEQLLYKRAQEIQAFISDKPEGINGKNQNIYGTEKLLEKIIERDEMIRFIDNQGHEIYNISDDFPDFPNKPHPFQNGFHRMRVDGEDLLIYSETLTIDSFKGTLVIGRNVETFEDFMEEVLWVLMLGTLLSLGLSLISGLILARKLLSPLRLMSSTMRKIQDHQFQERIPVMETKDEFSQISSIFNSMMDKIEDSIQQQKRFIEDASHELRTPLSIIHGHLSLLQRWGKNDKEILESSLNISIKETNRMVELTNDLLQLSQLEKKKDELALYTPCHANDTIDDVISNYLLIHRDLKISKLDLLGSNPLLAISQKQLIQILMNIMDNAIKYSGERKDITLIISDEGGKFKIEIQDKGYGISTEDLPYIFDRFYRVDKARSRNKGGNGLGLSIVKDIIEEYNGEIKADSTIGEGTTITLLLPYSSI